MTYVIALLGGAAFGIGDQYLGSRSALGAWAVAASNLSAIWLLLGFVAGLTQKNPRRAMALGLVATLPAVFGYFAMTCSPIEGVPAERFATCFVTIARSPYNPLWIAGAILFGPLYGLLGQRWRVSRWWVSAVIVACTLFLEPLARMPFSPWLISQAPVVWCTEVIVGIILAGLFARMIVIARRDRAATGTS